MGWWKKLKIWYKAAFTIGCVYLVVYLFFLYQAFQVPGESVTGYITLFMTFPWAWIFFFFGFPPSTVLGMVVLGIFSAIMNSITAMVLVWLISTKIFHPNRIKEG